MDLDLDDNCHQAPGVYCSNKVGSIMTTGNWQLLIKYSFVSYSC